jgi:hypothetical protein
MIIDHPIDYCLICSHFLRLTKTNEYDDYNCRNCHFTIRVINNQIDEWYFKWFDYWLQSSNGCINSNSKGTILLTLPPDNLIALKILFKTENYTPLTNSIKEDGIKLIEKILKLKAFI